MPSSPTGRPLDQRLRRAARLLVGMRGSPESQIEQRELIAQELIQIANEIDVAVLELKDGGAR